MGDKTTGEAVKKVVEGIKPDSDKGIIKTEDCLSSPEWPATDIELVKISGLKPYENNSRLHSDEQIDQIIASIGEWGWTNPILIDEVGMIIAGHGRVMAAQKMGIDEVPAITAVGWTEEQKRAYVIADNQLAENASWDEKIRGVELQGLEALNFDMSIIGIADTVLNELLAVPVEGLTDEDAVPEIQEDTVSVLGDVWILGNHRLMCGDSTSIDAVEKLMDGAKPDLLYTDPPYGISENGDRSSRGGLCQGNNLPTFNDSSIEAAIGAIQVSEVLGIKRQVWWGANYYCHALPQGNNWFVWDKRVEDKQHDTQSDCEMAWVKSQWSSVRIFRHLWKGMMKDSERGQKRVHATQKPVALAVWAFEYYKKVESVLDLFTGSGSTLIACEQTGRRFYGMELMPEYSDVIIRRWQDFTGKEATHAETGKTFSEISEERLGADDGV